MTPPAAAAIAVVVAMGMVLERAVNALRSFFSASAFSEPAPLDQPVKLPAHVIYVRWQFTSPLRVVEWDLTITEDPGSSVGEYLALFSGSIDGSQCYLGLQTNVSHPEVGRGIGKGLIFSTWWSFDESDTRLAAKGFRELGTHEGRFVGIRRPYEWTTGDYRVTLARAESDLVGGRHLDWFDLSISRLGRPDRGLARSVPVGPSESIGGLRFPRRNRDRPATVDAGGLLFFEIYSGARTWADVAPWHLDVMAYGDGTRCPSGRVEYPRFPFGQRMPNANVRFNPASARVELRCGAGVVQADPPTRWPSGLRSMPPGQ